MHTKWTNVPFCTAWLIQWLFLNKADDCISKLWKFNTAGMAVDLFFLMCSVTHKLTV